MEDEVVIHYHGTKLHHGDMPPQTRHSHNTWEGTDGVDIEIRLKHDGGPRGAIVDEQNG